MPHAAKFIQSQKKLLLLIQDRLEGRPPRQIEDPRTADLADLSQKLSEMEETLTVASNSALILRDVRLALHKICKWEHAMAQCPYGVCEHSGQLIPEERLESIPWARFTVQVQAEIERGRIKPVRADLALFDEVPETSEEEEEEAALSTP